MISAFGVDHGYEDIEKFSIGGLGGAIAGGTTKIGNVARRAGAGAIRGSASQQSPGGTGVRGLLGRTGMRAGGQLKKLGAGMAKRPNLTAGAALGTGTAGVAGGGFAMGNRRKF